MTSIGIYYVLDWARQRSSNVTGMGLGSFKRNAISLAKGACTLALGKDVGRCSYTQQFHGCTPRLAPSNSYHDHDPLHAWKDQNPGSSLQSSAFPHSVTSVNTTEFLGRYFPRCHVTLLKGDQRPHPFSLSSSRSASSLPLTSPKQQYFEEHSYTCTWHGSGHW